MLETGLQLITKRARNLYVGFAATESEVLEAQKLRYRVFAEEMGAKLQTRIPGVDADRFDPYFQHLIVRDEDHGKIVGTYRLLTPEGARRLGGYYSETEFDLSRFHHLRNHLVEVGRSCVDPDYRNGVVITLLWSALIQFMKQNGYEYLMGCATIGMADGGHNAANVFRALQDRMAPLEYRVFPHNPLPVDRLANNNPAEIPPLLKGYLRCGVKICGEPAWDPDFNAADLLIVLAVSSMTARYDKRLSEGT